MARLVHEVAVVAANPVPVVLVVGESGTGKQLIANMLHTESPRSTGPMVSLNAATVPEELVESEFFGYERGAFSDARDRKLGLVEVADGGTLFLDEIGELSAPAQAKLLTFLDRQEFRRVGATQSKRVDVRIVAATNRNLGEMVSEGSFRPDLRYRLDPITIHVPPLRERREDIAPIAEHFLDEASRDFEQPLRAIAPETVRILEDYAWPGNVRELRAVIRRAALFAGGEILAPEHLPAELVRGLFLDGEDGATPAELPTLAEREMTHIRQVLAVCGGNRTLAASYLGITRQTLARRLAVDQAQSNGQALTSAA